MNHCKTDNLALEACIPLKHFKQTGIDYAWRLEGMNLAPEYTLSLYERNGELSKTYTIIPSIVGGFDTLIWQAAKEDFVTPEMHYELMPTSPTEITMIKIYGKITTI